MCHWVVVVVAVLVRFLIMTVGTNSLAVKRGIDVVDLDFGLMY